MPSEQPLIDVEDALERLLAAVPPPVLEDVPVTEAIGRALVEPVRAVRTLPPWDNSAMDGYAVRSADVQQAPVKLRVEEVIYAGATPTRTVTAGTCARIMTGAPLPPGADAVVMQERTRPIPEHNEVEILQAVRAGQAVRPRGEDAREGAVLLEAGAPLGIPEAGLLWAQGLAQVRVPRRPKVAIISTGDELCELASAAPDRIVDTNSLSLEAAVRRAGGEPVRLGIAPDRLDAVQALLARALEYDVVLSSAGVSVGERDFVREALTREGVTLNFWRVAIKPGKPLAVGTRAKTLFVGLPGNPTSSLVTFDLFVRPALRRWLGHRDVALAPVSGTAGFAYEKAPGLTHYVRVVARWEGGSLVATALPTQTSGALRSAASATHLLRVPKQSSGFKQGQTVELLPVSWTA